METNTQEPITAQMEEQENQCIFCKIAKGDMESKTVYTDNLMQGILDVNPWLKGHVLLLPIEHHPILPVVPPDTFKHMFGLMPKLVGAIKSAMVMTGANVIIANGGIAGQQAPHFLLHILPRENNDGFDKYLFEEDKSLNQEMLSQANAMLVKNIPIMINNHFTRNPAKWRTGEIKTAEFLKEIKKQVVYEDEKVLCVVPENPQCVGHLTIYSQEEEKLFENLSEESSSHMFYCASYCATAVFEGLKAQGSNIILKTGISMDNPSNRLCIHILPRYPEDGLDVIGTPMENKPDLDSIASRIKDKTFAVEHHAKQGNETKQEQIINLDNKPISIDEKENNNSEHAEYIDTKSEIEKAIENIRDS